MVLPCLCTWLFLDQEQCVLEVCGQDYDEKAKKKKKKEKKA